MPEYLPSSGVLFIVLAAIYSAGFLTAAWVLVRLLTKATSRYEDAQKPPEEKENSDSDKVL